MNPTAPNHPTVPFLHPLPASLPLQHSDNANRVRPTVTGLLLQYPKVSLRFRKTSPTGR
ncbi:hypothetical protein PT2222_40393 [Paraburkholderia tropica]